MVARSTATRQNKGEKARRPGNLVYLRPAISGAGQVFAVRSEPQADGGKEEGGQPEPGASALNSLLTQLGVAVYVVSPGEYWYGLYRTLSLLARLGIRNAIHVVTQYGDAVEMGRPQRTWMVHKDALLDYQLHHQQQYNYIWLLEEDLQLAGNCTIEDARLTLLQQWKVVAMEQGRGQGQGQNSPTSTQPRVRQRPQWDAFHFHYQLAAPFAGIRKLGNLHKDEMTVVFTGRLVSCSCLAMNLAGVEKVVAVLRERNGDMRAGVPVSQVYRESLTQAFSDCSVLTIARREGVIRKWVQRWLVHLASCS